MKAITWKKIRPQEEPVGNFLKAVHKAFVDYQGRTQVRLDLLMTLSHAAVHGIERLSFEF